MIKTSSICNLADDISVSYMNYHPIFGCVVLILVRDHQSLPCNVVSFTLLPPSKSHLLSFELDIPVRVVNDSVNAVVEGLGILSENVHSLQEK